MATEITVSNPHGGNWLAVQELELKTGQRGYVYSARSLLADCYHGSRRGRPLVFHNGDGEVVGLMSVREQEDTCWLEHFQIGRRFQRQGVGRAALTAALELLRSQGYRDFALQCDPQNTASIALWRSVGFETNGERLDGDLVARLGF